MWQQRNIFKNKNAEYALMNLLIHIFFSPIISSISTSILTIFFKNLNP